MDGGLSAIVSRVASVRAFTTGNAQMAEGSIKKLTNKGFGFIACEDGTEVFFHHSAVQGADSSSLREGQALEAHVGHAGLDLDVGGHGAIVASRLAQRRRANFGSSRSRRPRRSRNPPRSAPSMP